MGVYGSPELPPDNNRYDYQYQYQGSYKPKAEKGGCLKNVLMWTGLLSVFLILFYIVGTIIQNNNLATRKSATQVYSSPVISNSETVISSSLFSLSSDSKHYGYSDDAMVIWAQDLVKSSLSYPETAQFSKNDFDWKFSRDGNIYGASSFVLCRSNTGVNNSRISFEAKSYYYEGDSMSYPVYLKLGDEVLYDITAKYK